MSDPGGVAQVIRILLDNALRFSGAGGAVAVTVGMAGGAPEIVVQDSGPGVAPEERELIFERFGRGRAGEATAGFGLGLAIGRELARRLGGDLRLVESERGARFVFALPAAAEAAAEAEGAVRG